MTDDEFLAAFETCVLPKAEWTHVAHVRMAWLYVARLSFETALDRIRSGIRRYNASVGSDGYHDTITIALTLLIRARLETGEGFATFAARNPDLFENRTGLLGRHYDPATLASAEARRRFVLPDRDPLPGEDGIVETNDLPGLPDRGEPARDLPCPTRSPATPSPRPP
jgi:hypothetical protein